MSKIRKKSKRQLSMSTGGRLVRGSAFRSAQFGLQVIVSFIMTPLIVHSLGDRLYGFWALIGTFIGYYGLLDLGLSSAVQRYVSRALGQNDEREMRGIINTAFFLFLGVGLVALLISVVVASIAPIFLESHEEVVLFRKIILLLGLSVALGFPVRVFNGVLSTFLRYDLSVCASTTRIVASNIAIFYFLRAGYGILSLAVITFLGSVLEYALIIAFSLKTLPSLRIKRSLFQRKKVRDLFGYSTKTFVSQIADILRFKVDNFVVAGFLTVNMVTYYSIGARLVEYFGGFMTSVTGIMTPVFSRYEGKDDYDAIRERFLQATKICTIFSVFTGASIIYYGKPFIQRWMGGGFESSYFIAVILCVPNIFALMQVPSINLLYGISKHHFYAISNSCEGLLNLGLSLLLVKWYGIYGVALGTAIEMMIFKLFIQPVFACRSINISLYEYYVKTLLSTSIKTSLPLLAYFYFMKYLLRPTYGSILSQAVIQTAIFLPIVLLFVIEKSERSLLKRAITG